MQARKAVWFANLFVLFNPLPLVVMCALTEPYWHTYPHAMMNIMYEWFNKNLEKLCVWGRHSFSVTTGLHRCDWAAMRHPLVLRLQVDNDQQNIRLRRSSHQNLSELQVHRRQGNCHCPQKVWTRLQNWRDQKLRSSLEDTCQWWKGTTANNK